MNDKREIRASWLYQDMNTFSMTNSLKKIVEPKVGINQTTCSN